MVTSIGWKGEPVTVTRRREHADPDGGCYSLPREGTPAQVVAGLEQARLAAAHIAADPWERGT